MLLRRDSEGRIKGCLVSPPKWLQAWVPEFGQLQAAQDAEQDLEALCVLYVALTRAKEATFVILQNEKPRRPSRTREWLLGGIGLEKVDTAAPQQPSPWGEGELVWERGSSALVVGGADEAGPCVVPKPDLKLATPLSRRERRRPSDAGHAALAKEAPLASAAGSGGQEFGTAVHAVFEQIEWWEPGQPGRDVSPKRPCLAGSGRLGEASLPPQTPFTSGLMQSCLEGPPDAVGVVQKCLEAPEIRALFQKEAPPDEACRELPVELIDGNVWWSGIVDRLVLRWSADGTLRKAVLVDFKTDNVAEPQILRDRYSEQLAVYRRAIALALKLTEAQVEAVLVSTHLRQVVAVAG
jgi:ATP-dependent helicase/nuclease subunit A